MSTRTHQPPKGSGEFSCTKCVTSAAQDMANASRRSSCAWRGLERRGQRSRPPSMLRRSRPAGRSPPRLRRRFVTSRWSTRIASGQSLRLSSRGSSVAPSHNSVEPLRGQSNCSLGKLPRSGDIERLESPRGDQVAHPQTPAAQEPTAAEADHPRWPRLRFVLNCPVATKSPEERASHEQEGENRTSAARRTRPTIRGQYWVTGPFEDGCPRDGPGTAKVRMDRLKTCSSLAEHPA